MIKRLMMKFRTNNQTIKGANKFLELVGKRPKLFLIPATITVFFTFRTISIRNESPETYVDEMPFAIQVREQRFVLTHLTKLIGDQFETLFQRGDVSAYALQHEEMGEGLVRKLRDEQFYVSANRSVEFLFSNPHAVAAISTERVFNSLVIPLLDYCVDESVPDEAKFSVLIAIDRICSNTSVQKSIGDLIEKALKDRLESVNNPKIKERFAMNAKALHSEISRNYFVTPLSSIYLSILGVAGSYFYTMARWRQKLAPMSFAKYNARVSALGHFAKLVALMVPLHMDQVYGRKLLSDDITPVEPRDYRKIIPLIPDQESNYNSLLFTKKLRDVAQVALTVAVWYQARYVLAPILLTHSIQVLLPPLYRARETINKRE